MRDKPCQKGNQPCRCNASLSCLSCALFTRYAYTNTHTHTYDSFQHLVCFLMGTHSAHRSRCGLFNTSLLHFKANKSIPFLYLWLNRWGLGSISSDPWDALRYWRLNATQSYSKYQWRYQVLIGWVIDLLSPSANQSIDARWHWSGVQCFPASESY